VNEDTGFTPNLLHIGRELANPFAPNVDLPPMEPHSHATALITKMQEVLKSKNTLANRYNAKRKKHDFKVGVVVTKENNKLSCAAQGYSASLAPARSSDIYVITEQLGENSFALAPIKGRKKRVVANADQLQIFTQRHAQN